MLCFSISRVHAWVSEVLGGWFAAPCDVFSSRRVIGDPALAKDYERDNVLFWIADVYHGEEYACTTSEGFSIMDSLVALSYEVCEYPSLLFLAHVSHRLVPLELVTGMIRAAELLEKTHELQAALLIHEEAQRERTDERSAAQRIRDEQDAAYRRSLEADAKKEAERKRAEKLQEEEQARERALAEQQDRRKRERQSLIARLQRDLPAECDASDAIRLSLQLLDGKRVIRKWAPANTVEQLYDWAFVLIGAEDLEITRDNFTIRPMLPPMPFARSDRSLKEAGIQHQMKLIVVLNDVEEDE